MKYKKNTINKLNNNHKTLKKLISSIRTHKHVIDAAKVKTV